MTLLKGAHSMARFNYKDILYNYSAIPYSAIIQLEKAGHTEQEILEIYGYDNHNLGTLLRS